MKNGLRKITAALAAILLSTSAYADPVVFGDGGVALQGVLDSITTNPVGDSSVDVTADEVDNDGLWTGGGSGGSIATLVIELASFSDTNVFGIYDAANSANTVTIFDGPAGPGDQGLISILADGSVLINFVDTLVDFASGNMFGFFLDSTAGGVGGGIFYSQAGLNSDGVDHLAVYQGVGDQIQILPFAPGPWTSNEYILAFEDLDCDIGCDADYTDFVVLVESITPVPAPGALALLGLGLVGFGAARRRKA